MAEMNINFKVLIDENAKKLYLSDLATQIELGIIDEDEAIALIKVDYKKFVKIEVIE